MSGSKTFPFSALFNGIKRKISQPTPFVIALIGPTASGKTQLAVDLYNLAKHHGVQCVLVNIDSVQCYKYVDIGTAKPLLDQRTMFALMDIAEPDYTYSVAHYVVDARKIISRETGKLIVLVGGTMMYLQALQSGLSILPVADPKIRENIEQQLDTQGYRAMHNRLAQVDSILANRLECNDRQRLIRGLEVYELTQTPLSTLQNKRFGAMSCIQPIMLVPNRKYLHHIIEQRLAGMLRGGFVDEVIHLRKMYPHARMRPAMRSVGYRQIWDFLEGDISQSVLSDRILFATRQLAKRQYTWMNKWSQAPCIIDGNSTEKCMQLVTILARMIGVRNAVR